MASKVQFGLFTPQDGMNFPAMLERTRLAERAGFHSLWLVDHVFSPRLEDMDYPECLALLSALAVHTEKIRLGTMVLCNSFRNPALLAKSLTTIDHLSNGRLEAGFGAGWAQKEYQAYGYEFPGIGTRLAQLDESLQILRAMFTEPRASFSGRYFRIENAPNNPKPLQKPRPPITVGGSGEKVMLRIVAKYADWWNCPAGYRDFGRKLEALKGHCRDIGRDFDTINISEQVLIVIGKSDAEVEAKWKSAQILKPFVYTAIKGTPPQVIEQIRERAERGVKLFVTFFSDFAPPETIDLFGREVMPAFA
ncbi:MAG: TIGR03560 family F420-dependent LLM class oxidoreductase [Candidatus Binataceae bacterium]